MTYRPPVFQEVVVWFGVAFLAGIGSFILIGFDEPFGVVLGVAAAASAIVGVWRAVKFLREP